MTIASELCVVTCVRFPITSYTSCLACYNYLDVLLVLQLAGCTATRDPPLTKCITTGDIVFSTGIAMSIDRFSPQLRTTRINDLFLLKLDCFYQQAQFSMLAISYIAKGKSRSDWLHGYSDCFLNWGLRVWFQVTIRLRLRDGAKHCICSGRKMHVRKFSWALFEMDYP